MELISSMYLRDVARLVCRVERKRVWCTDMLNKAAASIVVSLAITLPALGQVQGKDAVVRPVRTDKPPKIDGRLDEPMWAAIEPITDFTQYEPVNGEPATERTEVRICYDDNFLYFGVRAYDSPCTRLIRRTFSPAKSPECKEGVVVRTPQAIRFPRTLSCHL